MKVAMLSWWPEDPSSPRGGVEAVTANLAEALASRPGVQVDVVTVAWGNGQGVRRRLWRGVRIHQLSWSGLSMLGGMLGGTGRRLRRYVEALGPDIVHAHDTFGLVSAGMVRPRVFTIHGFIYADTALQGGLTARLRSLLWRRVETARWARQPHIVSISPYVSQRLRGLVAGQLHDIVNPISRDAFEVTPAQRQATVFSAAVISPRKNAIKLVEALALLKGRGVHVRLRLAGALTDEAYAQRLRQLACRLGLEQQVQLLGSLNAPQVRRELAEASVFALVSLEEGAPMAVAEAMAAGVPVVASNRCGLPFMVDDGSTGLLVEPTDEACISSAIERIVCDADLAVSLGAAASLKALERYHPDAVAAQTVELYEQILEESRRSLCHA